MQRLIGRLLFYSLNFLFLAAATTVLQARDWRVLARSDLPSPGGGSALQQIKVSSALGHGAEITCLIFSSKRCQLRVIDRPDPASPKLAQTMRDLGFLCGVNGGFFGKRFEPLGWVVSGGREINPPIRARLLTGAFYQDKRRGRLARMGEIPNTARALEALQAGPFLVDGGLPVSGLEATRPAARTFIATDGAETWCIGVIFSPTLAEAGTLLAAEGLIEGIRIQRALNLDGGRSSGFWAAQPGGRAVHFEEISDVRNYLGVSIRGRE